MTLTATARAIPGTLRQEIVIDGQHRLITDQPEARACPLRRSIEAGFEFAERIDAPVRGGVS
jgi:hypothetical protein